jgi:hypothetical protein
MALTEFEQAILDRLNQLSPEERKIQSETNVKKMGQNQLSPEERRIADQRKQLSPEERKIQSKTNVEKMGQRQIDARNAKAQAYIDKKTTQKPAYKAGRASAKAQQAVKEGAKQLVKEVKALGPAFKKGMKDDIKYLANVSKKVASSPVTKAAGKMAGAAGRAVAPVVEGVRAARLLTSEDYRKQNEEAYEDLGEKNAFLRAVEGGLGGVSTIYATGKNMLDTVGASARGRKSGIAAEEGKQRLIEKGILDESGKPISRETQEDPFAKISETTEKPAPTESPKSSFDGEALSKALIKSPAVQPAETAPRTSDTEAAYKQIESGNVPKAIPVDEETLEPKPQLDEGRMAALFRTTTGTSFNPKSKADMGRMQQLRDFVDKDPDMLNKSNTKIALDFYRTL